MPKEPTDVYHPEAFKARVAYYVHCCRRGINSRRTDACFEMKDGAAVAVALVRKADADPALRAILARGWSEASLRDGLPCSWRDHADKFAHVPTKELPALARQLREHGRPLDAAAA